MRPKWNGELARSDRWSVRRLLKTQNNVKQLLCNNGGVGRAPTKATSQASATSTSKSTSRTTQFKKSFSKREPEKMPFVQNSVVQHPNKVDFDFWTRRLLPDTWLLHVYKKWALVLLNILIELKNEIVHGNRNVNAAWLPLVVIVGF